MTPASLVAPSPLVVIATQASGSRPAYRRDLLSCLAYEDGHRVSFLYRRRWIAETLRGRGADGRTALLVYCHPPAPEDATGIAAGRPKYVPLRYVTFEEIGPRALLDGDLATDDTYVTVTFTLGKFVNVAPSTLQATFQSFDNAVGGYPRCPKPGNDADWVFELEPPAGLGSDESAGIAWPAIVSHLAGTDALAGCTFMTLAGMVRLDKSGADPRSGMSPKPTTFVGVPAYRLDSKATYGLVLDYFAGTGSASAPAPEVTGIGDGITVSPAIVTSLGETRRAVLAIRCRPTYSDELSVLVVDHKDGEAGLAPRLELPVVVSPARSLRFLPIVLVLGFALNGVSVSDVPSDFAVLAIAGKVAGALMVGLGVWWGFRRLPGV